MPEEPTYMYVKGQGWIPNGLETFGRVKGQKRVVFAKRDPGPGEYYYAIDPTRNTTQESILDSIMWQVHDGARTVGGSVDITPETLKCYRLDGLDIYTVWLESV